MTSDIIKYSIMVKFILFDKLELLKQVVPSRKILRFLCMCNDVNLKLVFYKILEDGIKIIDNICLTPFSFDFFTGKYASP